MEAIRVMAVMAMSGTVLLVAGCTAQEPPPTDLASGTTAVDLSTHCGIRYLRVGVDWFERVGGPLVDDGNPPSGWRNPSQPGRVTVSGHTATFTDDAGHKESFEKLDKPPSSATNCA
jgi:hypothetical protein